MLGSSNNDRQLQKRHKMLRRELSNLDWNGFVVRDVLEVHVCTLIVSFRNFRVLDDFGRDWTRQNLDLWDRVWAVSMSAVMSFALVFILLDDMSMGFVRTNHGDLFCSHVKSCAWIDSWLWVSFACLHRSASFCFVWYIEVWLITYYLSRCAARILG